MRNKGRPVSPVFGHLHRINKRIFLSIEHGQFHRLYHLMLPENDPAFSVDDRFRTSIVGITAGVFMGNACPLQGRNDVFVKIKGGLSFSLLQKTDTGLKIDLLQEYVFLPLDNYREILHNKGIRNQLEAWLAFLSVDEPEIIVKLVGEYPQFKEYYEEIYRLCMNTEKVMNMFSKELQELDRNTVQYMIDEMQNEIDALKLEKDTALKDAVRKESIIAEQNAAISAKDKEIAELRLQLAKFSSDIN